jgi:phage terminase small subunit
MTRREMKNNWRRYNSYLAAEHDVGSGDSITWETFCRFYAIYLSQQAHNTQYLNSYTKEVADSLDDIPF